MKNAPKLLKHDTMNALEVHSGKDELGQPRGEISDRFFLFALH